MEISYLPIRMYPGICPAGTNHFHFFAAHFCKQGLQLPLNGIFCLILPLPALIFCSFILKYYFYVPQLYDLPRIFPLFSLSTAIGVCIPFHKNLTAFQRVPHYCFHALIRIKCHMMRYRYIWEPS